jgi:hypothetical protein
MRWNDMWNDIRGALPIAILPLIVVFGVTLIGCQDHPKPNLDVPPADKIVSDLRAFHHVSVDSYVWIFNSQDELRVINIHRYTAHKDTTMLMNVEIESIKFPQNSPDQIWLTGWLSLTYENGKLIKVVPLKGMAVRKLL